jgi:hypothetical protein
VVNVLSTAWWAWLAIAVCAAVRAHGRPGGVRRLPAGNWPVPFGIVLVADRLSALMLVLTRLRRAGRAAVRAGALAARRACTSTCCSSCS